jgi:type II secretory pathway predicted ATPase ExeA
MPIAQTFETFVRMQSTSVAYRICRSKADGASSPAVVILFGESGSGKTHLLRAVVDAARRRSGRRVESTRAVDMLANILRELTWRQAPRAALSYYEQLTVSRRDQVSLTDAGYAAGTSEPTAPSRPVEKRPLRRRSSSR